MKEIYRENYNNEVYMAFYDYVYNEVEKIQDYLMHEKNEIFELDNCYEVWIENNFFEASETLGYQVEDYDIQMDIQKNLESDLDHLQWDISLHNERVINE